MQRFTIFLALCINILLINSLVDMDTTLSKVIAIILVCLEIVLLGNFLMISRCKKCKYELPPNEIEVDGVCVYCHAENEIYICN